MPDALSSRMHVTPVRVYYEDTDAAGIVYYANYLKYAERARTELLRRTGIENGAMMAESGAAFAVKHCSADYIKPARLDDALEVVTTLTEMKGASLTMHQDVCRGGEVLVAMDVRLACIDVASGRAQRLPAVVRNAFQDFLINSEEAE